jgi:hypothetical protein
MDKKEFEELIKYIVEVKGNLRFLTPDKVKWKVKLPKNNEEFKKFTKKYYGVELNAKVIVYKESVRYKILEAHNDCMKNELYKAWEDKFGSYDGLTILLNSLFGELSCGGVATSHYGDTHLSKDKCERLLKWDNEDNETKKVKEYRSQSKDLKEIFGI